MKRIALIILACTGLTGLAANVLLNNYLDQPLTLTESPSIFAVPAGASLKQVAASLNAAEQLEFPAVLTTWGGWSGYAEQIKAGEYAIERGTTPRSLMQQLIDGQVLLHSFTILEGWTVPELLTAIKQSEHLQQTLNDPTLEELSSLLDLKEVHPEGQFYPDTYRFPRDFSDTDILRMSAELMQRELANAWENRDEHLPLKTPYELLTLASIIERETGLEAERSDVAGVFVRRLSKDMLLQTDPTVIYGLGDAYGGNLTRRHLRTDTPYNTYTRKGLPPTPISLPSAAALHAAAHPAKGTALFFVARGNGSAGHEFSDTLEQHNAAVGRYLARLREARRQGSTGSRH